MIFNETIYRAGIYCRLSSDDGNVGDSSSIQTQKMMLERFCKENGYIISNIYVDDGWSGGNFNRPEFKRMIQDIEDKKINMVITKDLSRLDRDYLMTGHYMEMYFPSKNVRYIALNDGIDTYKDNNDIAPFKNILNDMYLKDISKKVKSARRQRALQGMFLGGCTPYGYKKNPSNKNELIIDEEPAKVIKYIFKLALLGLGSLAIAKELTKQRIINPSSYKSMNGDTRFDRYVKLRNEEEVYKWSSVSVNSILRDMVYIGDMENLKAQVVNYKTKQLRRNSQDKRIVVKDTHKPIIERSDFERVQELLQERKYPVKHNLENIFKGLVYCGCCKKRMTLAIENREKRKTRIIYKCNSYAHFRNVDKHCNIFHYHELKNIVTDKLRSFFSLLKDDSQLLDLIQEKYDSNKIEINYDIELEKIEKRLAILSKLTKKIYEDYANEIIDDDSYQSLLKDYQAEQKELKSRYSLYINERDNKKNYVSEINMLKEIINDYLDFDELTSEMVYKLIDRIEIYSEGEYGKPKQKTIKIVYRFIDLKI